MKNLFTNSLIAIFILSLSLAHGQETTLRWISHGSSPGLMFGEGVSTDTQGNAYVTGYFNTTYALLGDTVVVTSDRNSMFLSKVSPDQELLWTVTAEADGPQGVTGFKTYVRNGFIYLMGDLRGTATFGSLDFTEVTVSGNENRTMYIAKYTTGGILEWVRTVTTTNSIGMVMTGSTFDLTVDHQGAVYVSAAFRNSANIAGVNVPDPTPDDNIFNALLFKLDANGAYQWHWNSVNAGADQGQAIAIKDDSSLFFTVKYTDSLTVGGHIASSPGFALVEFNLNGVYQWHHFMTNTANLITGVRCFGIEFDEAGDIYMAGSYRTDILWDQETGLNTLNAARSHGFVIKIDGADKSWVWGKALGDPAENDEIRGIGRNSEGNFMISGIFRGNMVLNEDLTLTPLAGSADGFWAMMDTTGLVLTGKGFGGTSNEVLSQMAISPNDHTYMIGRFQNDFQYEPGDTLFNSWGSFDFFLVKLGIPSADASLSQILIDGNPLQGFQPDELHYDVFVSSSTQDVPVVAATPASPYAEVVVEQASSLQGTPAERTATITVTSENEENTLVYTVLFDLMNDDATLAAITLDGQPLDGFDPQVLHYEAAFPSTITDVPVVEAEATDPAATVTIQQAVSFTGTEEERTATIEVVSQDPSVSLTYTVTFRYMGSDATLTDILVDGTPLEGFEPEDLWYVIVVETIDPDNFPVVEAIAADENASVEYSGPFEPVEWWDYYWRFIITVTAEDNSVSSEYILLFREIQTISGLIIILIDGNPVPGFNFTVFHYEVDWPHGADQYPQIYAETLSNYATFTINGPTNLEGTPEERTAFIDVVAENPDYTSQYTVLFNLTTNIAESELQPGITLYPNPVGNLLKISMTEKASELWLINAAGARLMRINDPGLQLSVDVSDLPAGVYFIHILPENHGRTITRSFIRK